MALSIKAKLLCPVFTPDTDCRLGNFQHLGAVELGHRPDLREGCRPVTWMRPLQCSTGAAGVVAGLVQGSVYHRTL